jgi:hypothetical protein
MTQTYYISLHFPRLIGAISKGVFRWIFFWNMDTVALFVCILQLVSNHRLIWLKRFVS